LAIVPQDVAPSLEWGDKGNHILAFVVLTLLLRLGYRVSIFTSVFSMFGFGIFIEISQYFTPTRCADYRDVIADFIGILLGLLIVFFMDRD